MAQDKLIDGKYEYFAFISYKEEDAEWAKWLQRKLEHYKLPTAIRKENPELPERISPIYEYKSEAGGGRLKDVIWKGLTSSKYLIIICSPRSGGDKSQWINNGIRHFIESGQEENIIPFIVEGTPKANNLNEECFPNALLGLKDERELRGININEMGRNAAAVKVVSRMFDMKFDMLWQRYEREQRKKRWLWGCSAAIATLMALGVALFFFHQNSIILNKDRSMLENQSRAVAEKIHTLIGEGDLFTAQLLALEILPDVDAESPRPYTPEAEIALREALVPLEKEGYKQVSILRGREGYGQVYGVEMSKVEDYAYFINGGYLFKQNLQTGEEWQFEHEDVKNRFGSLGLLDDSPIFLNKDESKLCVIDFASISIYYIWDTKDGKLLSKGEFKETDVNIEDNKQLLASLDKSFIYDDAKTTSCLKIEDLPIEIRQHVSDEYAEVYSSNSGNYIIVEGKVFSKETRKGWLAETKIVNVHPADVTFSKDNRYLAIGTSNGYIRVLEVNSLKEVLSFKGSPISLQHFEFSEDGSKIFELASDSIHSELLLYDKKGELLSSVKGIDPIKAASVNWKDGLIATLYNNEEENTFKWAIWDISTNSLRLTKNCSITINEALELYYPLWESSNSLLFLSHEGSMINRWRYKDGSLTSASATPTYTTSNYQDLIFEMHDIGNDKILLAALQGNHLVMDKKYLTIIYPIKHEVDFKERENAHIQQYIATSNVSQDLQRFITVSIGGVLRVHDVNSGLLLHQLDLPYNGNSDIQCVSISHDGYSIVYCFDDSGLYFTKLVTLNDLIKKTKASLKGRKLSEEEKRRYYLK